MPLIEIINITLLAFSLGLLALMGISYLVYRFRDLKRNSIQSSIRQNSIRITSNEIKVAEKQNLNPGKQTKKVSRYQLVKTYSQSQSSEPKFQITDKFVVINKTAPSIRKTHSPKFIYLVTSSVSK